MSSYAKLNLGLLEVGKTKREVDPLLMLVFRSSEKCIDWIDQSDRKLLAQYVEEEYIDEFNEESPLARIRYCCTASAVRDRLDLMGVTYKVAIAGFELGLEKEIQELKDNLARNSVFARLAKEELPLLESLTIISWLEAIGRIQRDSLTREMLDSLPLSDGQLPLLRYILGPWSDFYWFPGYDCRLLLRLLVEDAAPQELLIYDLTELVVGEYLNEADDPVAEAEHLFYSDFTLSRRVIVLTEGETDRRVLERSLKLLYPHLVDYFHFFDFVGKNVGGGAGQLANLVRSFAAADVRHRILALFDNDTAARAALSNLDMGSLSANFAVCQYPNIPLAENYPTLGPSGEAKMNVNELAGGIELYLGRDALEDENGELTPVQWKGFDPKVGAYQGEVLHKNKVLTRFEDKISTCESQPKEVDLYDWSGIRAILDTMRAAFHCVDAEEILSGPAYE